MGRSRRRSVMVLATEQRNNSLPTTPPRVWMILYTEDIPSQQRLMKFAVLGCTSQAIALIQEAIRLGHEVTVAYDAASGRQSLRAAAPNIRFRDHWEELLGDREIDALIVAGPILVEDVPSDVQERRDDQLRKLIQASVPLVVIPPVCEAIVGFELEMIRRDVKGIIVPAWGAPLHLAIGEIAQWTDERSAAAAGKIELLAIERFLPVRQRAEVLPAFAHDAEILRRIAGPLLRLTASGTTRDGEAKPSLANATVHADTESGFPCRWSVGPANDFAGAMLTLQGSSSNLTLKMPTSGAWELTNPAGENKSFSFNSAQAVLGELERVIPTGAEPKLTWLHACRAVEAMEAIDRSVARNRAIELYNEEPSEESSFKGIMAASGCLMLLGTLAAIACAGGIAVFLPPGKRTGEAGPGQYGQFHSYWTWLQVCLIVPLAIFLLVQLLSLGLSRHLRSKAQPAAKIAD